MAECCELLLKHGADPTKRNHQWDIPLHLGAKSGSAACCEFLLQYGSDPNSMDNDDSTPLHRAASASYVECCEMLVSYGADPMLKDGKGQLPLQVVQPDDDPTRLFLTSHYFEWDAKFFRELCEQGKATVLRQYLDNFRLIPHPPRQTSRVKVFYHDLYRFYGPPWLSINDTPLYQVLSGEDEIPSLVDHPVFEHVLNLKWAPFESNKEASSVLAALRNVFYALKFQIGKAQTLCLEPKKTFIHKFDSFGRLMYISESLWFLVLLVSTYWSFVSVDAVAGRDISMISAVFLLKMEALDWSKRRWSYFKETTNWINLVAYGGVLVLGILAAADFDLPHLDITRSLFIVLLCFCGLEYLRMVPLTSLLIAITFKMVKDVVRFVVLYGVFQIGFSGSFFLLFQHEDSRYNSYGEAFLATFLMLFGDFDADLFLRLEGVKAVVANVLVLLYLVGAMVMLMNLLIAMMSTSYQEVLDSAKAARSIARAETILRMESLLPHRLRAYMFEQSFHWNAHCQRAYRMHAHDEAEEKAKRDALLKRDDDLVETEELETEATEASEDGGSSAQVEKSNAPLLGTIANSQDTVDSDAQTGKTAEERPVATTAENAIEETNSPSQSQSASATQVPTVKTLRKPNHKTKSRLRQIYAGARTRPQLDDCEYLEYVDGNENFQNDLQQAHKKLETKLEKNQEQLAQQLDVLQQELKQ